MSTRIIVPRGEFGPDSPMYVPREEERQRALESLNDVQSVLFYGGPGVGKTTLSYELAADYANSMAKDDHVLIVSVMPNMLKASNNGFRAIAQAVACAGPYSPSLHEAAQKVSSLYDAIEYLQRYMAEQSQFHIVMVLPSFDQVLRPGSVHDEVRAEESVVAQVVDVLGFLQRQQLNESSVSWASKIVTILSGILPFEFAAMVGKASPYRPARIPIGRFEAEQVNGCVERVMTKLGEAYEGPDAEELTDILEQHTFLVPHLVHQFFEWTVGRNHKITPEVVERDCRYYVRDTALRELRTASRLCFRELPSFETTEDRLAFASDKVEKRFAKESQLFIEVDDRFVPSCTAYEWALPRAWEEEPEPWQLASKRTVEPWPVPVTEGMPIDPKFAENKTPRPGPVIEAIELHAVPERYLACNIHNAEEFSSDEFRALRQEIRELIRPSMEALGAGLAVVCGKTATFYQTSGDVPGEDELRQLAERENCLPLVLPREGSLIVESTTWEPMRRSDESDESGPTVVANDYYPGFHMSIDGTLRFADFDSGSQASFMDASIAPPSSQAITDVEINGEMHEGRLQNIEVDIPSCAGGTAKVQHLFHVLTDWDKAPFGEKRSGRSMLIGRDFLLRQQIVMILHGGGPGEDQLPHTEVYL